MKKLLLVTIVWFFIILSVVGYAVYWIFFDWSRFADELINTSTSPNGTYTINAYISDGGATTSYAVLGELVFNEKKKRPKKIYWQYRTEKAEIEWMDDQTVMINKVKLNLPHETYDYRRGVK
ncbi:DUF5412 domain-containing protein [Bacillus sp. FJAT-45037]|uniref:DUF5412 domain-containing protein n=1 Tax=Bacillus sp. FJAT-45037 TaxID=2011007 RepID=UPI000C24B6A4|nr:DUF5412 domain-containing protein [Bacillus sp. FJAT-45037]